MFELCSIMQCTMFTLLQKYEILSPGERIESFAGMEKVFKNGMLGIHLSRHFHFTTFLYCKGDDIVQVSEKLLFSKLLICLFLRMVR